MLRWNYGKVSQKELFQNWKLFFKIKKKFSESKKKSKVRKSFQNRRKIFKIGKTFFQNRGNIFEIEKYFLKSAKLNWNFEFPFKNMKNIFQKREEFSRKRWVFCKIDIFSSKPIKISCLLKEKIFLQFFNQEIKNFHSS